jgi:hypothetical protein
MSPSNRAGGDKSELAARPDFSELLPLASVDAALRVAVYY